MKPAKILIVDDQPMFRRGLRACLEERGLAVVGEAATPDEAVEHSIQTEPDLVIMAAGLFGGSGIAACREIRLRNPTVRVLLTTILHTGRADLVQIQAFLAGASGYVPKRFTNDQWYEAITQVLGGRLLFPDEVVWRAQAREALTKREAEVLALLAEGMTNLEIASRLVISPHTVATHVSNILSKMRTSSRYEAAETWRAMETGTG